MSDSKRELILVEVEKLRHIEDYGRKRVSWLKNKILNEGYWTVPLKVEKDHFLVMDGQHRMEVAKALGLKYAPCLIYTYDEVDVWSLRNNYEVNSELIIERSLSSNIYPYKTAKHAFPDGGDMFCSYQLNELKG